MDSKETCVYTVEGEINAQQVKAFLDNHDIPCRFNRESVGMVYGLTIDGLGVVEIHVSPEHVMRARELFAQVEAGELEAENLLDRVESGELEINGE